MKHVFYKSFLLGLFVVFAFPEFALPQLSPGELAREHSHLEGFNNCSKCHSSKGKGSTDPSLCLDCHKEMKMRIKNKTGLHGLQKYNKCGKCHFDHLGRKFKLVNWKVLGGKAENFKHELSGFELKGAHKKLKCNECHQPKFIKDPKIQKKKEEFKKKTYLGLKTECLACHKDVHKEMFGKKNCLDCHNSNKWKPAEGFDHNRQTKFRIKGKHKKLTCVKCHKRGQPWELPKPKRVKNRGCISCHKDVHKGKFGKSCQKCHQESGFKRIKVKNFDHSKTEFPLEGKHVAVNCNQCHKKSESWVLTKFSQCIDCHDNFHKGEFKKVKSPEKCEDCHSVKGYVPANYGVEEHNKTDFPLKEAHLAAPCILCHTKSVNKNKELVKRKFKFPSMDCNVCHKDPHRKQVDKYKVEKGCLSCHSGTSWSDVHFDHGLTGYSLTGRHQKAGCRDCHSKVFSFELKKSIRLKIPDFEEKKKECFECHKDPHQGQFKELDANEKQGSGVVKCDKCHTTTDWYAELFEHNTQSRFKLDGAHEKARCEACHLVQKEGKVTFVRYKPLSIECKSCHGDSVMVK